jgi:hypothetical protein
MRPATLILACEYLLVVYDNSNMIFSINGHSVYNRIDFRDEFDDLPALIENSWNNFVEKVVPRKLYMLSFITLF